MQKKVFVTVGTTQFEELIDAVTNLSLLELLEKNGYNDITIQKGNGRNVTTIIPEGLRVHLDVYEYKKSIIDDMKSADLIVSHCGAGCLMEALALKKRVIAVVNKSLWDNHQLELAQELSSSNHLIYTTPESLFDVLKDPLFSDRLDGLSPFPAPTTKGFVDIVNQEMSQTNNSCCIL
ncbi:beta-1,4-N-acetylglucosaminyltransferase ALG13 [Acrasis kona]|uniref:UDP-N-acetylglucosamine transferase subunit ALG13 n=1 Tax=Acrasis kona TaxID=1008807 RepID=A0AAW2Z2V5_9EUKA